MSKVVRKRLLETVELLEQGTKAVSEIGKKISVEDGLHLLTDCQELAIALGTQIEKIHGMGTATVVALESYCEAVYETGENFATASDIFGVGKLIAQMQEVKQQFDAEFPDKIEIVFFPYKASMWDSLESIWAAADADEDCEVYVVPIPFFDKNPDGSVKEEHYEAELFPDYVTITDYRDYDVALHHPDVAYIHNPYDEFNYVTSVNPAYYSKKLKAQVEKLVYVPYYATAGGMADAQAMCSAYRYVDYIVTQAEKYKGFFDPSIPKEKFLPFGSPKFDKAIRLCENPPEPPEDWKDKLKGRTVYFYNTSITGMLDNTSVFLKKMEYVFDTFAGREDVCLLWRPHPLLESTFESLRKNQKPEYDRLKARFIEENLGIYDTTPSIEETIALSDVYIGDAGTSVTSLFGVCGKPIFLLNNYIDKLPTEQDQKDQILPWPQLDIYENEKYQVMPDNTLWVSEQNDHHYRFYMKLDSVHSGGGYYMRAMEIGDYIYVLPQNAQHMLIIRDKEIVERVEFKDKIVQGGAFNGAYYNDKYIFLFPFRYHSLVRYHLETGEVSYVPKIGEFRTANVAGEWHVGGGTFYGNELVVASPVNNQFLFIDMDTLACRALCSNTKSNCGVQSITPYEDELWLLPLNGMTLARWNPKTGEVQEYHDLPEGFCCREWPGERLCNERPFGMVAIAKEEDREHIVIGPSWGNMFVQLDRKTGRMEEWKPAKELSYRGRDCYHLAGSVGGFAYKYPPEQKSTYRFWYAPEQKLLEMNIVTGECKELELDFELSDAKKLVAGFAEESDWIQYDCLESAYNSLKDLLDDNISGNRFDKERALAAFSTINASVHGECGERVHAYMKEKVQ